MIKSKKVWQCLASQAAKTVLLWRSTSNNKVTSLKWNTTVQILVANCLRLMSSLINWKYI